MNKLFPKSLLAIVLCCSAGIRVSAQERDTIPAAEQPVGLNLPLGNSQPQQYEIADIVVSGTQYLDKSLLISLSGLNVGDKVVYPGGDQFAKAIQALWGQRLFANVAIYVNKIQDGQIWLEIELQERPRLNKFLFKGVKKSEQEEIIKKTGMRKGQVVTESMEQNAVGIIRKYYSEKGFRNAEVSVNEQTDSSQSNATNVQFIVAKGNKAKVDNIYIVGNQNISDSKLKKK
ncbi:MAG: surface antigen variable number repeat protein, partial [Bacteroidetes bacterium]|nr:surface antigen variable number repeat protein [Bacteroidota bacterium]